MRIKAIVIIAAIITAILACWPPGLMPDFLYQPIYGWRYPKGWQCGDAIITDYGPGESRMRYLIQLGKVELKQATSKSWSLCELPEERLIFGLSFGLEENRKFDIEKEATKSAIVAVKLYDETQKVVFGARGSLEKDWFWTFHRRGNVAFVYAPTAFKPEADAKYRLEFEVISEEKLHDFIVNLDLVGGGWK